MQRPGASVGVGRPIARGALAGAPGCARKVSVMATLTAHSPETRSSHVGMQTLPTATGFVVLDPDRVRWELLPTMCTALDSAGLDPMGSAGLAMPVGSDYDDDEDEIFDGGDDYEDDDEAYFDEFEEGDDEDEEYVEEEDEEL